MIEDAELRREIEKALARADQYWMLARELFAHHRRAVEEVEYRNDVTATIRKVRARSRLFYTAVAKQLNGRPAIGEVYKMILDAVANSHHTDELTVKYLYEDEARRRRKQALAMRNLRILLAVKVRGERVKTVARRFDIQSTYVSRLVTDLVPGYRREDVNEAIAKLKAKIAWLRGPRLPKAEPTPRRSSLAQADPRAGDDVLLAEIDRWRQFAKKRTSLGRRSKARPRLRMEGGICLHRALGIAARSMDGIEAKLSAAEQLTKRHTERPLALLAMRSAQDDATRLSELTEAPADTLILNELQVFRDRWRQIAPLGRCNRLREALRAQAMTALLRAIDAPAHGPRGIAAKLAVVEVLARSRPLRRLKWNAMRSALRDARRLTGQSVEAEPATTVVSQPAGSAAPASDADAPIVRAICRWYDAIDEYSIADDQVCATCPGGIQDDAAPAEMRERGRALLVEQAGCWDVAMTAPSLTPVGIAAKLRLLSEMLDGCSFCGEIEELFHAIVADASRLAGHRDHVIVPHTRTLAPVG